MTKEQFTAGQPFAVFGILCDFLVFNAKDDKLLVYENGKVKDQTYITDGNELQFTCFLTVFGVRQVITIPFSYCELKQ